MSITEETRHPLYEKLEEVLGSDEAATLMEHLPPVGWADVATKRDLDALQGATKREFDALRHDLEHLGDSTKLEFVALEDRMSGRLERELRLMSWRFITALIAVAGVAIAAVRI